jgi:hypothetical protein
MKTHELKTWPEPFRKVVKGDKRYEIRKNDRGFAVNDILWLREWDPAVQEYTKADCQARVISMTSGGSWGLPDDLCVMSIEVELDPEWHEDQAASGRRIRAWVGTKESGRETELIAYQSGRWEIWLYAKNMGHASAHGNEADMKAAAERACIVYAALRQSLRASAGAL